MDSMFPVFEVTFNNTKGLGAIKLPEQLGFMASIGNANVGNVDLFSRGIARRDFPDLFAGILKEGKAKGLILKDIYVRRKRITFILKPEDGGCDVRLDISLEGSSGRIQIDKDNCKFIVEWTDSEVKVLQRIINGQPQDLMILD